MRPRVPCFSKSFSVPRSGAIPPMVMNATLMNKSSQPFISFSITVNTFLPCEFDIRLGENVGSDSRVASMNALWYPSTSFRVDKLFNDAIVLRSLICKITKKKEREEGLKLF